MRRTSAISCSLPRYLTAVVGFTYCNAAGKKKADLNRSKILTSMPLGIVAIAKRAGSYSKRRSRLRNVPMVRAEADSYRSYERSLRSFN